MATRQRTVKEIWLGPLSNFGRTRFARPTSFCFLLCCLVPTQTAVNPPSTTITWPVTNEASSEAR